MLLKVIEWVWFILGGKDGERKEEKMKGRREEERKSNIESSFLAYIHVHYTVGGFA